MIEVVRDQVALVNAIIGRIDIDERAPFCATELFVICLEDRRFLCHSGVDVFGIIRATIFWLLRGKKSGASTIEQQLVRTITGKKEKTLKRKLFEAVIAIIISKQHSKEKILRLYLATAYMGWNKHGIGMASQQMFGTSYTRIDLASAARLASLLAYPMPRKANKLWKSKHERRAKYGSTLKRRAEYGFSIGPLLINFESFPPFVSCSKLKSLLQNVCDR